MDDTELIKKILARDRHALAVFYRTYTPKLMDCIAARVNSTQDAEEILQDTLFGFLEGIRDFHGKSSIKTFLFAIAHHKIIDYYRRKKFKHIVFSQSPNLESFISPLLNPEEELDVHLLREKIQRVLQRLLPRYRQVLLLKYMEHSSVEDIATRWTVSLKSVESQLFRARKAFVDAFVSM